MSTSAPIHMLVKYTPEHGDVPLPMQLVPDIPGESVAIGFIGQILLDKIDWEVERSVAEQRGEKDDNSVSNTSPDEVLNAAPSQLTFEKAMDLSTCMLLTALEKQRPLDIWIRIVDTAGLLFMTTLAIKKALLVSYDLDGSSSHDTEGRIGETWTLEYQSIKFEYIPNALDAALTKARKGISSARFEWKPGVEVKSPSGDQELRDKLIELASAELNRFDKLVKEAREKGQTAKAGAIDAKAKTEK